MRVIHKEGPFNPGQPFTLKGITRLVHFGEQAGELYVWFEKDLEGITKRDRCFVIVATGQDYEQSFDHVQTVIDYNLRVWHILRLRDIMDNFGDRIFC